MATTDLRPMARAILQDPHSPAYARLVAHNAIHLNRGTAVQALPQGVCQIIINTRDIPEKTITDLLAREKTGTYGARTRNSKPRKEAVIPPTHTIAVWIALDPTGKRLPKADWHATIQAIKDSGGVYGGEKHSHAWYLHPDAWHAMPTDHNAAWQRLTRTQPTTPEAMAEEAIKIAEETTGKTIHEILTTHTSPAPAADTIIFLPSDCQTPTTDTNTTEETITTMTPQTTTDADFSSALARLKAGYAGKNLIAAINCIATLSETVNNNAKPVHDIITGNSTEDITDERDFSDVAECAIQILSESINQAIPEPGTAPSLREYSERGKAEWKSVSDPTGLMRAREEFAKAGTRYNQLTESWILATSQTTALESALCEIAVSEFHARQERIQTALKEKAEEEAQRKAQEALKGAQIALDAIRQAVTDSPTLPGGYRPSVDSKYNCPPSFQRLFSALAFQLALTGKTENLLFTGPKGTGKTKAASQLAASLGLDFYTLNCQTARDAREVFAERNAEAGKTLWTPTDFTQALTRGNCVILLDEITRAGESVQNAFLSLLDGQGTVQINGYGTITVGKNIVWVATANEGSAYSGTKRLDLALDDRFSIRWEMQHLAPEDAANALMAHLGIATPGTVTPARMVSLIGFAPHGITHAIAVQLAQIVQKIQKAYASNTAAARLTHDEGQRTLEGMGRLYALLGAETITYSLLSKYKAGEERNAVARLVAETIGAIK